MTERLVNNRLTTFKVSYDYTDIIFLPDVKDLDGSTTSSLSTSTGLSSSHSTVDSVRSCNRSACRDLQSPSMSNSLLDKESMVANFGDSKVGNDISESSVRSGTSESFTPGNNAEDSGIDDRSGSIEKVRLEIVDDGDVVRQEVPVAVSSPAEASTPITEIYRGEKQPVSSSSLSDENENELCSYEENELEEGKTEMDSSHTSKEGGKLRPLCSFSMFHTLIARLALPVFSSASTLSG